MGVGRPGRGDPRDLADFVLSDFEPHDDADRLVANAADAVELLDDPEGTVLATVTQPTREEEPEPTEAEEGAEGEAAEAEGEAPEAEAEPAADAEGSAEE